MKNNQVNIADEFQSLVKKISQKAQELNEIAHELELFYFEGENQDISSLELYEKTLLGYAAELTSLANRIHWLPLNRDWYYF